MLKLSHYVLPLCLVMGFVADDFEVSAQQSQITVHGQVRDENDQPIANIIIINRRTREGSFGRNDGSFTIQCLNTDTIAITSMGYFPRSITFRDSLSKDQYRIRTYLNQRTYRLPQVEVFAARDLDKIQADILKLGYREEDYMLSGINAAKSPITFLYQQFSRKERSKRLVKQMENEDLKRALLKELFKHYVDYQIIELTDAEFDQFIDFINVPDDYLIHTSQYDFLIYVKDRFIDFRAWKRRGAMREADFNYDQD